MSRWWKGLAVGAAWLGLGLPAPAQGYAPSPVGAARVMPDPLPCGPASCAPEPNLVPGPLSPEGAPPGPPDCLSLPAGHSSAFQCENYSPEKACYFSIGAMALQRQKLGAGGLAVIEPLNVDTGIPPPPNSPLLQRYKDLTPDMSWGIRGTAGFLFNDQAIELTAWYVFKTNTNKISENPGQIDAYFFNPPLGFEGDNGLWLQADRFTTNLWTRLLNAELNYRCWNVGVNGLEFIAGFRSVVYTETLNIFTQDDAIALAQGGFPPDPTRSAGYTVHTRNYLLAGQVGCEYEFPIWRFLSAGFNSKVGVGPNFSNTQISLVRGDGFTGFNTHRNNTSLGQVYELGGFFDFHLFEKARLRAGYMALWLVDVSTAQDQVDFNLANTFGQVNRSGSVFFHGPLVELQLLF